MSKRQLVLQCGMAVLLSLAINIALIYPLHLVWWEDWLISIINGIIIGFCLPFVLRLGKQVFL